MNRLPIPLRFLLVVGFVLTSHMAFCWGVIGHRVIGDIAQEHLSKKAKKGIKKLIGRESLAQWSNWGDYIKSDTTWKHAYTWHFVDLPGHMEKQPFIDGLKKLPGRNLYNQIIKLKADLVNESLSITERQQALYWLIHLMGDLHQPLHVGRDEDQGGNKIVIYWFDKKTNLHSLWDSMLIEFQQYSYSEYARYLDISSDAQVKNWQSGTLEDWFYDSHELSDKIYDNSPNESKQSYTYNYMFKDMLDMQLLKGGVRLAALLNDAFN